MWRCAVGANGVGHSMNGSRRRKRGRIIHIGIFICGGSRRLMLRANAILLTTGVPFGEARA